jgi:nicotinamide-nucleotide amidase
VLERIEVYFKSRGRDILETNRQQADLPKACTLLLNEMGTASGMWFEKNGKVFVSMPGVPYEMKHLMSERVLPMLQEQFDLPNIYHKTIMTEGIGESFLVEIIRNWESATALDNIRIAYLPSPGIVKVRLSVEGNNISKLKAKVDKRSKELVSLVPEYVFGEDDILMEVALGNRLRKAGKTIATAESCTGGYIAHLLTSVAGSSDYFLGSIVSYSNKIKTQLLGVQETLLEEHGAVSREVVEQMAMGVREKMDTSYGLATSGIAGPEGGSEEKPVGTVWIALSTEDGVFSKKFNFEKNRKRNIRRAALAALSMLRREMDGLLEMKNATKSLV